MQNVFHQINRLSVFAASRKTLLGKDAVSHIGEEAKKMGAKKFMIITDAGLTAAGLVERVLEPLKASGLEGEVFDGVLPEPPARIIDECAEKVRAAGTDLLIGFGGGSSMDVAKGVAALATNPGSILDYTGMDQVPKRDTPLILIPTTGGTGSESTRVLVMTDEADNNTKKIVYSDCMSPDLAILDPSLTLSVPPTVTADTGMDALVHAVETYVSTVTTPYAEMMALQAITLIAENLPQAFAKGSNEIARYNMLFAANLAGMAFGSGGLGAVHGLAYVLGTEYHMSHGRSNAIMLPHVMEFNKVGNLKKYAEIAEAMGEDVQGLSSYEAATMAVEAVYDLMEAIDISPKLGDYGIPEEDLPKLVEGAKPQARLFVPNPRDLREKDIEAIYRSAL